VHRTRPPAGTATDIGSYDLKSYDEARMQLRLTRACARIARMRWRAGFKAYTAATSACRAGSTRRLHRVSPRPQEGGAKQSWHECARAQCTARAAPLGTGGLASGSRRKVTLSPCGRARLGKRAGATASAAPAPWRRCTAWLEGASGAARTLATGRAKGVMPTRLGGGREGYGNSDAPAGSMSSKSIIAELWCRSCSAREPSAAACS
jgi:hypothetical protein